MVNLFLFTFEEEVRIIKATVGQNLGELHICSLNFTYIPVWSFSVPKWPFGIVLAFILGTEIANSE